jgi:outer membrane lipoprotein SlyB
MQRSPRTSLPHINRQIAGGTTGAVVGAVVGGPLGAVVGGVTGMTLGSIAEICDATARKNSLKVKFHGSKGKKQTPLLKTRAKLKTQRARVRRRRVTRAAIRKSVVVRKKRKSA